MTAAADDHTLRVGDAADWALEVDDYTSPATSRVLMARPVTFDADALTALRAALPARAELGPVPAFFENRDDVQPAGPDGLTSSSSADRPVLAGWSGAASLLAAYTLQAVCVRGGATPDYGCPCFTWTVPLVGTVAGNCVTPPPAPGAPRSAG